jgi:hypothetical protein
MGWRGGIGNLRSPLVGYGNFRFSDWVWAVPRLAGAGA